MFHSRTVNHEINQLHKKALEIVYSDFKTKFDELLELFSMLHRNI